jgi:hypothetical protein
MVDKDFIISMNLIWWHPPSLFNPIKLKFVRRPLQIMHRQQSDPR